MSEEEFVPEQKPQIQDVPQVPKTPEIPSTYERGIAKSDLPDFQFTPPPPPPTSDNDSGSDSK
ncbi:MAG: hypothetical protein HQ522_06545 [Bacteroidetes bacterium]|nr:hypothetical protein [Bacteroidota bacterium]